uniref:Uncharacterized protein n=1 Tax=Globodera rostochiensis TaxID=31243 RepID=A0A914H5Q6_GLORO
MAKIGLCAKVCWFIYAQSVLLQLVHHNQRANAAGLKVYISPTGIHYHVNVYGTQNGNYGKIATAETKTEHPSEREIAVLNKKKFDGVTDVRFSFTPTNQQDNNTMRQLIARQSEESTPFIDGLVDVFGFALQTIFA